MTPIAHALAKDMTLPVKARRYDNAFRELGLKDFHFFECSEVYDLALDLVMVRHNRPDEDGYSLFKRDKLHFLPGEKVLIEFRKTVKHKAEADGPTLDREGFLLERRDDGRLADVRMIGLHPHGGITYLDRTFRIPLFGSDWATGRMQFPAHWKDTDRHYSYKVALLYSLLSMINMPRSIMRVQHAPHIGLERAFLRDKALVGTFPRRAWTEIKLEIRKPKEVDAPEENHLTGRVAYHWTRAHWRYLREHEMHVFVNDYWSGDPALGIKQSRYALVA
jgi:hypothetical protein